METNTNSNTYFESKFSALIEVGLTHDDALIEVCEAYLAGKPYQSKKQKKTNKDRLFWSSSFLSHVSPEVLNTETFILVLARYFSIETVSNFSLLESLTYISAEAVRKSIKRSEIVLSPTSTKWQEVKQLASRIPSELTEITNICKAFQKAHRERLEILEESREVFKKLTIFELLSYSSIYAFKYLMAKADALDGSEISTSGSFHALKGIVEWKLTISDTDSFLLTDEIIGMSLKAHQSPLVFPGMEDDSIPLFYLHHFERLVRAQVELDGFLSRSITPFCFEDECEYYLDGEKLLMRKESDISNQAWLVNGNKQNLIDGYWFNRGFILFVTSGLDKITLGTIENQEQNQIAYVKSLGAFLQLSEIYGLEDTIKTDNGFKVDIQKALLSLELMIAFYSIDFIAVFMKNMQETGNWKQSLSLLAASGFRNQPAVELRFPITWSKCKEKAERIVGWTASNEFPKGNIKAAEAVLDFWSLDFKKWSIELKGNKYGHLPELTERPIFKLGNYYVQLPWMMANQATNINVINNLRRFANKRPELQSETQRIEKNLGANFKRRGFMVIDSYEPEREEGFNPGEIDLICALENRIFVIEVKSTYRRTSTREALRYRNSTLRKAGLQIKDKTEAIKKLIKVDQKLRASLGINNPALCEVTGWIADTSLEYDHEFFNGYLKISVDELNIALNDSVDLMMTSSELVGKSEKVGKEGGTTLYEHGFNALTFKNVIEDSKVWSSRDLTSHNYEKS